jgi:hypothetical protein
MMPSFIDLVGRRFGSLVVVALAERTPGKQFRWACRCDCGGCLVAQGNNLRNGHTQSCGCLVPPHKVPGSLDQRIVSNVIVSEVTGCWEWQLHRNRSGYGHIKMPGQRWRLTHRASYEQFIGPIPSGMLVLHKCDVRHCVNPDHLFLGDDKANYDDMVAKGRAAWQRTRRAA